ncbi:MAG: ImmA/IrrE family metallo-endopeptidase [Candidatus Hydrogenedentes bacterium]|nr:ImmA/IrrE family metallo-endopeptidase [Candidatus Hydrogenedentota bacterium]
MEQITSINPKRIAWCCTDYGITPSQLASEIGFSAATMERVMSGNAGLTFNQLNDVAEYFGRGILFFLEDRPVDEAKVHTAEFRTLANQKPELSAHLRKLIERVERQREVYLSLLDELDEAERHEFSPPSVSRKDIPKSAAIAREWLDLREKNNFDSYRSAVEAKGILVFRSNGYAGQWQIPKDDPILGFALYGRVCPTIVIKKQASEARQTFTLMHELGHILLHKRSLIDDEYDFLSHDTHEQEANAFAGHLLVPDAFLRAIRDAERPTDVADYDKWLESRRKAWGVSGEVILRRLLDAGRLPGSKYTAYRKWRETLPQRREAVGSRAYRYREPRHVFGDTFVRTVLDALNANRITLARASAHLDGLKIRDLHRLENLYAGL